MASASKKKYRVSGVGYHYVISSYTLNLSLYLRAGLRFDGGGGGG